ncbi:(Fe-S)-binding protein [Candidatus Kapabacteria bacterium]|nr:(Fe-S)-binding protein [Candidatus Kapabacteria bacterium]
MFEFGLKNWIFISVFIFALAFFLRSYSKLIAHLQLARADDRMDNIIDRLINTFVVAIAQKKILRDKKAGPIHAMIFWGFLILGLSAVNSVLTGFGVQGILNYLGPIFTAITVLTDIFIILIIAGVIASGYRRLVIKVPRLHREGHSQTEATVILAMIFTIVTSLMFENAAHIVMHGTDTFEVRPIAYALSGLISADSAPIIYEAGWWIHIIVILAFTNLLPYSKHLHVLTSVPNVFFSNTGPTNKLSVINFEDDSIESYGVTEIEDFSWKTLHDSYTCTECGRCTSVCPANQTGKILDPREIMVQIRSRTMDRAPILHKLEKWGKTAENWEEANLEEAEKEIMNKKLIGDYVNPEALWQCTTCSACMQECPVNIEHVPAIVEMRRSLVMMEAEFPEELQTPFNNIENNAAPWAFAQDQRADWTEGTTVKEAANKPDFDILFWVGCAGSFDDRTKNVTKAFAKLMDHADINFAILGKEEACTGDPARRAGNEYLADSFVRMNVETMNGYDVKKIVTTCPHCLNTLKNEYPQFGGNYEVELHTEFLDRLMDEGKIPVNNSTRAAKDVTIHDSCYAGRLNNIYKEPRNLLKTSGLNILETRRTEDKGLCCGAGGGQMFMEENEGKRVNMERTEELLETGAETIALNCPFCMTMITDGVKTLESKVQVKDISEIILESIEA